MFDDLICAIEQTASYENKEVSVAISKLIEQGSQTILMLVCDTELDISDLPDVLQTYPVEIVGIVVPGLVWQQQVMDTGLLCIGFKDNAQVQLIHDLPPKPSDHLVTVDCEGKTLLVFIDGLSKHIETCVHALYDQLGNTCTVLGAGAGSLTLKQKPCIITSNGVFSDAMLLIALNATSAINIAHGWQPMAGPFLATKVQGNDLMEVNFSPAFELYCQHIELDTGIVLDHDNFFQYAKDYPLGLDKLDDDMLVRDPIKAHNQSITCVGSIPENSMFYLLKGDASSLIKSSSDAATRLPDQKEVLFVIDCVSRKLFLQHAFEDEITGIREHAGSHKHFIAILALGEIATGPFGTLNFFNKTSVISALSRQVGEPCSK